ncbi:hypothetical protein L2E82_45406 [Cichorium intybus]|uniref:Uncharacterized protein n=1 Tax=Cichorium intybus TaxID=13427 RepID=A0ACB8ZT08_CICIN|nr:hypothetical protein L2E82_45406 [Cichorium intybus]
MAVDLSDSWELWNSFHVFCEQHSQLLVAFHVLSKTLIEVLHVRIESGVAGEDIEGLSGMKNEDINGGCIISSFCVVLSQAVKKGKEQGFDIVLCDTSGRLHTNYSLMEELIACKKVVAKIVPVAPNQV